VVVLLISLAISPAGAKEDHERRQDRRNLRQDLNLEPSEDAAGVLNTRLQRSARDKYLQLVFVELPETNLRQKTRNSFMEFVKYSAPSKRTLERNEIPLSQRA
jgi:hypothetical protein